MRKFLTLITLILSTELLFAQQDAQQSQYMFNGLYINPAYAGYKEDLNLHSYYRSQWTGIAGSPVSMSIAIDAIANDGNVGLAFQLSNDRLGAQSNIAGYANYSYRIRMNADASSRLAFGFGIGAMQLGINGAELHPNDPEPTQPPGIQNVIVPDGRIGVYYSSNKFYAGLSGDNVISQFINVKNHSYIAQPKPHFYFTTGVLIPVSDGVIFKPSVLLKDDRGGPTSFDINTFLLLGEKLWVGGSYRSRVNLYNKSYLQHDLSNLNSGVLAMELLPIENLRIGYAYDFSVGSLQSYSGGTHELSIGYYFRTRRSRMLTPRYF